MVIGDDDTDTGDSSSAVGEEVGTLLLPVREVGALVGCCTTGDIVLDDTVGGGNNTVGSTVVGMASGVGA